MINNYLLGRKMYVTVSGSRSSLNPVTAGVPQASILGPILFNIYINDIPSSDNTQLAVYANDTAIYASSWSSRQATKYLQEHIDRITEFLQSWKLKINPQKAQAITFIRKHVNLENKIKINGYTVPWSNTTKYLGLTLDSKLPGPRPSKKEHN